MFIIGLISSSYFMGIFDISADTLIHCAIVDERTNGQPLHLYQQMKE